MVPSFVEDDGNEEEETALAASDEAASSVPANQISDPCGAAHSLLHLSGFVLAASCEPF